MQKKVRLYNNIQAIAGVLILTLPLFIFLGQVNKTVNITIIVGYLFFCFLFTAIYFLHTKILFPLLYGQKKYGLYFGILFLLLITIAIARPFDYFISQPGPNYQTFPPQGAIPPGPLPQKDSPGPILDIVSIFLFLLAVIIGIATETNKQLRLTMQRALQAETEKANAELAFLKAQVNPHFLFNILNNVYTLAFTQHSNAAPAILKLSNMMRYLTDDARCDEVPLEMEIGCMTDYIDLQKLRLTEKTQVDYQIKGGFDNKKIAPLILMAFVENAFKYGVSNHKNSKLAIKLLAEQNLVNLYCENTIHHHKKNEKRTGIGMENTKKRLQYTYPGRHILEVANNQKTFKINLTIHLV